jgi:hypothetical protein
MFWVQAGVIKFMTDEANSGVDDPRLKIANDLIGFANDRMEEGADPLDIAAAMRNAGANFSAFARARASAKDLTVQAVVEEFSHWLAHYDSHHQIHTQPLTMLEQLVQDAKKE